MVLVSAALQGASATAQSERHRNQCSKRGLREKVEVTEVGIGSWTEWYKVTEYYEAHKRLFGIIFR